jgi:diphthamide synthase (EF-2-diphthine--ammonia ligase)
VRQQGDAEIVGLLTLVTQPYGRASMHGVRERILAAQARAAGLPLRRVPIPARCSDEVYQQAMHRAVEEAKRHRVAEMIFGDLHLEDVRAYREAQRAGSGIAPRFPLWGQPTAELAAEMISAAWWGVCAHAMPAHHRVAHVTCLDPARVPSELAGAVFDKRFLQRLPAEVDPCAEAGEFHTCVSAGSMFAHRIAVEVGPPMERDGLVFADLMLRDQ